jgi:hypothetical protein
MSAAARIIAPAVILTAAALAVAERHPVVEHRPAADQ